MRRNWVTEGYACQGEEHRQAAQQVAAHLATAHACEAQGTQHKSGSGGGRAGMLPTARPASGLSAAAVVVLGRSAVMVRVEQTGDPPGVTEAAKRCRWSRPADRSR